MSGSKTSRWLDPARHLENWASAWTNALFRLAPVPLLLLLAGVPTVEAALGNIQSAIVTGSVAAAALLLTRLRDVVEFSLWGVRGRLEKAVRDAEVTIQQLREMALAFAEASLSDLAAVGSIPNPVTIRQRFRIRDGIVASLQRLGVTGEEIGRVQTHWITTHCSVMALEISNTFIRLSDYQATFLSVFPPNDANLGVPTPQAFRDVAKQRGYSDPGLSDLLDEYERLFSTGAMRDPDLLGHIVDLRNPPD